MIELKQFRREGFTLIELIVTIAILAIVLSGVVGFFAYNLKNYSRGSDLAEVQFDVRMASEYVTDTIRNATKISEIETLDNSIDRTSLVGAYESVTSVTFEIIKEDNSYFLNYTIEGNSPDGKNVYALSNRVLLNNIESAELATGDIIYYNK